MNSYIYMIATLVAGLLLLWGSTTLAINRNKILKFFPLVLIGIALPFNSAMIFFGTSSAKLIIIETIIFILFLLTFIINSKRGNKK